MTWIVADWMARERSSLAWKKIREHLGPRPPRPSYARAMRFLLDSYPRSNAATVCARIVSDSVLRRGWALAAAGMGLGVLSVARRLG
jgi:hypothetical protein